MLFVYLISNVIGRLIASAAPIIASAIAKASLETPNVNTPIANNIKYKQIIDGKKEFINRIFTSLSLSHFNRQLDRTIEKITQIIDIQIHTVVKMAKVISRFNHVQLWIKI
jgi:hypothetical protein